MAVPETQRGVGKFDVLIKANDLAVYTMRITKNPKNFAPEYRTALTDDIVRTAKDIFIKCWTANNIRVGTDADNWIERKRLQEEAARDCNNLLALIQMAKPLFHLESKRVKYWGTKTIEVLYQLSEPEYVELESDQQVALNNLATYYKTTVLSNDQNCTMSLDYIADTKTYIDDKIAMIAKQIIDSVGGVENV